jgi:dynein heavy chain
MYVLKNIYKDGRRFHDLKHFPGFIIDFISVSKIIRVIRQPCGNMMLVGIGGSGHKSLTRLSSFICKMSAFEIEINKQYRKKEFRDGRFTI